MFDYIFLLISTLSIESVGYTTESVVGTLTQIYVMSESYVISFRLLAVGSCVGTFNLLHVYIYLYRQPLSKIRLSFMFFTSLSIQISNKRIFLLNYFQIIEELPAVQLSIKMRR